MRTRQGESIPPNKLFRSTEAVKRRQKKIKVVREFSLILLQNKEVALQRNAFIVLHRSKIIR